MQLSVAFHGPEVIAVEQPVDLLPRQRNQLLFTTRPVELLLGQALVIEHEAIVFPIQQLDLVPPPVGEGIQRPSKGLWPSSCSTIAARPRKLLRKSTGSRYR